MSNSVNNSGPIGARQQRRVERISQSTIELRVPSARQAFGDVRGILLRWLSWKAGGPIPETMQLGGTGELTSIGMQRVETAALDDPLYWAARQDDQDRNFPRRTWVTEAALAPHGDGRLVVGHRLHLVTLGEPAPFSRSVPRFMRDIAQQFTTFMDDSEVSLEARRADTAGDVDGLVRLLTSQTRRHPVIGISSDPEYLGDRETMVDADRLAKLCFGVAHVWVISRNAAFELTDQLGRDLSVFHGGVRSWRFPLSIGDSPFSHPLALARRINEWGDEGAASFETELVDWALRFSAGRPDGDKLLPPFAEVRQMAARLTREKARAEGRSDQELLDLALTENDRLTKELDEQKAEHAEAIAFAEQEEARVRAERDAAQTEVAQLRHRIDGLEAALRSQRQEPDSPLPDSLSALAEWAARELGDAVVLLPRAINAAKKSPFEDVPFVYRTLLALRDKYVPMRRGGNAQAKTECDAAWRELGLELTPSFAGTRAGQFGDEYRVKWDGRNRMLDQHLKGSNSRDPRYGFRCYFFWDESANAVVVGSLPNHLTTNAS